VLTLMARVYNFVIVKRQELAHFSPHCLEKLRVLNAIGVARGAVEWVQVHPPGRRKLFGGVIYRGKL